MIYRLPKYHNEQNNQLILITFLTIMIFSLIFYFITFLRDPGIVIPTAEDAKDPGGLGIF